MKTLDELQQKDFIFKGSLDKTNKTEEVYSKEIKKYRLLSAEQEIQLAQRIESGDESAYLEFFNSNLRMSLFIALKYRKFLQKSEMIELLDLIQAGNEGLNIAIRKFDWRLGFRFSTYAYNWIITKIERFLIDNSRTIRIPVHMHENLLKFKKLRLRYEHFNDDDDVIKSIAKEMKIDTEEVLFLKSLSSRQQTDSLDFKKVITNEDENWSMSHTIEDVSVTDPGNVYDHDILKENLSKELAKYLSLREIGIVELRYGLRDGTPRTLEELGEIFGFSKQRASQIETKALDKLKDVPSFKKLFKEFILGTVEIDEDIQRAVGVSPKTEKPFAEIVDITGVDKMSSIRNESPRSAVLQPFEYQVDGLQALKETRESGQTKALALLASGLGKTVLAGFDVALFLDAYPGNGRVLYLCHKIDILEQAQKTFMKILGGDKSNFGFLGNNFNHIDVKYLFATFQSLQNYLDNFDSETFDYIIIDEAHHSRAETYEQVITHFNPKFLLGLTATPDRGDARDIMPLFDNNVIFTLLLEDALVRGLLPKIYYRVITDEIINLGELQNEKISLAELNSRIFIPKRDAEIVKIIKDKIKEEGINNPRTVIFCSSIKYAEKLHEQFPFIVPIHSQLHPKVQSERRNRFLSGEIDTVVTVDQFNEGTDIPEANVAVFLRPTSSFTIFYQQVGRLTRPMEGKDRVLILDFVANCDRIEMVHSFTERIKNKGKIFKDIYGDLIKQEDSVIDIGSFNFIESTRDVISFIMEIRSQNNAPDKKEGWESPSSLMSIIDCDYSTIKSKAEEYRKDHPEWFEIQKTRTVSAEHYHPELVTLLKDKLSFVSKKPGWKNANSLTKVIMCTTITIKAKAEEYRKDHPEWFEIQKMKQRVSEHYHPDLVVILKNELKIRDDVKKKTGWESASSLMKLIGNSVTTIKAKAEEYRKDHPEWFEIQKAGALFVEHYHPDLALIIKKKLTADDVSDKKPGWESASSLKISLSGSYEFIKAKAEEYRKDHPEWFEIQKTGSNRTEHYHPDLALIIKKKLTADDVSDKKPGWESASSLMKIITRSYLKIKAKAEEYRKDHPEWFEIQKTRTVFVEHYHPDLVEKLKDHFKKE